MNDGDALMVADLLRDLADVEERVLALAEALTQTEYDWRPGEGVRSGGEVFMHVTTVNYAFPMMAGYDAPAETGLTLREVTVFGNTGTHRRLWVGHVGHLHEHLGQLIAYSRVNGIVPPWAR